ncbi:MAG: ribonuclease H family protein [Muribaculaceae bacterium]|nr:ribonuclease H family protein [Muribaculaceae bacterium]MDE7109536.1 ribonuclease H family protein [Muribaculaceae bacterium]
MAKGKKYYVVFCGRNPGVYDDWDDAREQIENFEGARYKGYSSPAEAAEAYRSSLGKTEDADLGRFLAASNSRALPKPGQPDYMTNPEVDLDAWAVDASCLGNPGRMEYQGVELMSGRILFRIGPFDDATNNIGEFLAIVHAMALMHQQGKFHNIYSDSVSGMAWVRNKRVKTQLKQTPRNGKVFELMARAIAWLNTHTYPGKVLKWQTDRWGEIPADFGRK